ncbi:hypothetical protein BJ684DRAFT_17468, partial [Piptocephalis cylindrospora]
YFPTQLASQVRRELNHEDWHVDSIVFPTFDTKGEYVIALDRLCEWVKKQVEDRHRRLFSHVYTLFLGHSMGGLLAADAHQHFSSASSELAKHRSLGALAYDTPYIGLHPDLFDRTAVERASQWTRHIGKAFSHQLYGKGMERTGEAMLKRRWGALAVVALSASALAAVVVARDRVQAGIRYITDHLEYVGALVREEEMYGRLRRARSACGSDIFHCFYTSLDLEADVVQDRTFILPPSLQDLASLDGIDPSKLESISRDGIESDGDEQNEEDQVGWLNDPHFTVVPMAAMDELEAHTNMFNPNINYNYDAMMEDTAWLITQRVYSISG